MMSSVSSAPPALVAPPSYMMTLKPGCRGDPRMNRAVAAKLKDPNLSLFDALLIGGFHYPRNVDAATFDNDRVTLGQRKNQLNRRLRLARQNLQNKDSSNSNGKAGSNKSSKPQLVVKKPTVSLGAGSPLAVAGSYLRQQVRKSGAKAMMATKRAAPRNEEPAREVKKPCLAVVPPTTTTVIPTTTTTTAGALFNGAAVCNSQAVNANTAAEGTSLYNALSQNMIADFSREATTVSLPVEDIPWTAPATVQPQQQPEQQEAWWPTTNPGASSEEMVEVTVVLNDQIFGALQQAPTASSSGTEGSVRSVSTASFTTDSATTVSSCPEAAQPVQQEQLAPTEDEVDPKENLGLRIFQANLQGLYQKSMMAAGFSPQEATLSHPAFRRFAFQAWKGECERLQVVLNDNVVQPQQPQTGV